MPLSTNSIFHFTPCFEFLDNLLNGKFHISYCLEAIKLGDYDYQVGIPMVSFCDIPLNQLDNHINSYGAYGIGLDKKWAKLNNISPVFYVQQNSFAAKQLAPLIRETLEHLSHLKSTSNSHLNKVSHTDSFNGNHNQVLDAIHAILAYTKNFEGILQRKETIINSKYRFYDEREWRFVPPKAIPDKNKGLLNNLTSIISKKEYIDWRGKRNMDKPFLQGMGLKFTPKDINYIIVKDEVEIIKLINSLKAKSNLFESKRDYEATISKIISSKNIKSNL